MKVKVKGMYGYKGHNISANGSVNLTIVGKYSELTNSVKLLQMLNNDVTIQINNTVLFWDTLQNFEYGTLTCREYDNNGNYTEFIWDYNGCKNNYYWIYKNIA